eukprot:1998653-Pyramimonas_sp.AAC.1
MRKPPLEGHTLALSFASRGELGCPRHAASDPRALTQGIQIFGPPECHLRQSNIEVGHHHSVH